MDEHNYDFTEEGINLLESLCMSLCDSEGKTLVKRHTLTMYHYLELRETGIKTVDLPYLGIVLEFFSYNLIEIQEYYVIMFKCLKLLQKPILLHKFSDTGHAIENLIILFSSLGSCMHLSGDANVEFMILDVIYFLLTNEAKHPEEISLEIRHEAVKNSFFPETIVSLMYFAPSEMYNSILEIMYQLSLQPYFANLFLSLRCMDFWIKNISIKNNLSINEASIKETTSNLLWSVVRNKDTLNETNYSLALSSQSLSVLRGWFRREVLFGQSYERNNVAALLLQIFLRIPNVEISRSGILQDIGLLAVATEFRTDNTWATRVKFKPTKEDMNFKKILVMILLLKLDDPITKLVLNENRFVNSLAFLLDFLNFNGSVKWNRNHHLELLTCCLLALPIISKHFIQEYTQSGATIRILQLIEYFTYNQQNLQLLNKCCLCLHLLVSSKISLKHFRSLNTTAVLINLVFFLMDKLKLNLQVQMILIYCFCVITNLIQDDKESKEIYGEASTSLSLLILKRFQEPDKFDSKISSSLLLSVCDFVWQCTIANDRTRKVFIDELGIYSILNVMEESEFVVQIIFLGMLGDLCIDTRCLPQIVTWRGKNGYSFLSNLCVLWRKQEKLKGVSRVKNGCIEDIEVSLMGKRQKSIKIIDFSGSPALVDLIGCARPKITILVNLLTRRHFEKVLLAKSVYQIPFDCISTKDEITLQIIKCYEELKEGEILWEIKRAVDKTNVILLPLDITVLHKLAMRQVGLANEIQKSQKRILKSITRKDIDDEKKLYKGIQEVKLTKTLKETFELDSYLTTSNKNYKKLKNMKYSAFLKEMDCLFRSRSLDKSFHKTFSEPGNFILVKTGRNAQIRSIIKKKEYIGVLQKQDDISQNLSDI